MQEEVQKTHLSTAYQRDQRYCSYQSNKKHPKELGKNIIGKLNDTLTSVDQGREQEMLIYNWAPLQQWDNRTYYHRVQVAALAECSCPAGTITVMNVKVWVVVERPGQQRAVEMVTRTQCSQGQKR